MKNTQETANTSKNRYNLSQKIGAGVAAGALIVAGAKAGEALFEAHEPNHDRVYEQVLDALGDDVTQAASSVLFKEGTLSPNVAIMTEKPNGSSEYSATATSAAGRTSVSVLEYPTRGNWVDAVITIKTDQGQGVAEETVTMGVDYDRNASVATDADALTFATPKWVESTDGVTLTRSFDGKPGVTQASSDDETLDEDVFYNVIASSEAIARQSYHVSLNDGRGEPQRQGANNVTFYDGDY